MKLKKFWGALLLLIAPLLLFAQQQLTEQDLTNYFDWSISFLTAAITYAIKMNIVKGKDENFILQFIKNSWVISVVVFATIAWAFVQFGFTSANVGVVLKFVGANFLGVLIGLFSKKPPSTPTLPTA